MDIYIYTFPNIEVPKNTQKCKIQKSFKVQYLLQMLLDTIRGINSKLHVENEFKKKT